MVNVEILRSIFDYLYIRLTEYSFLNQSQHQEALSSELETSPQFVARLSDIKCTDADLEAVLSFFGCFGNDASKPYGIYYRKMQDEYTVFTKTERTALLLEVACYNARRFQGEQLSKLYEKMTDSALQADLSNIFKTGRHKNGLFLDVFKVKNEGTRIKALHEKEGVENKVRHQIQAEISEQEELEEERERIEYENKIKQDAEKKYREEKQKAANAKNATTNEVKEVIKKMFNARNTTNPDKKTSEIVISITAELNNLITEQSKKNANVNDILSKFASKYQITDTNFVKNTIDYINKNTDGGQISPWCYQFAKK
jgi:hypothetical protein